MFVLFSVAKPVFKARVCACKLIASRRSIMKGFYLGLCYDLIFHLQPELMDDYKRQLEAWAAVNIQRSECVCTCISERLLNR